MIKALILDIDGTIQNKENDTDLTTIQKIKSLNRKGIKVLFATARTKYMVNKIVSRFNLINQHVLEDGGRIYDFSNEKTIIYYSLDDKFTQGLIEYLLSLKDIRLGVSSDHFYSNHKYYWELKNFLGVKGLKEVNKLRDYSKIYSLWTRDLCPSDVNLIEKKVMDQNARFKKALQNNGQYSCFVSPMRSTKENGVTAWSTLNKIRLKDILYIGDDASDINVSKIVGQSATLKNGVEEMKRTVDFVAPDEYDTGVLQIIKHYFNI